MGTWPCSTRAHDQITSLPSNPSSSASAASISKSCTDNSSGSAVTFLSEIWPEDLNARRKLWENVFDAKAKERFIKNVSGHISTVDGMEIIKRQIAVFRKVSEHIASRLEKANGVKDSEFQVQRHA